MTKKDFKTTSEMFFSGEPVTDPEEAAKLADVKVPEGYKLVREAKSRRMQIVLRPLTHARFKKACQEQGISQNELVNSLIENYLKEYMSKT